jgi:hypothetical protein
VVDQNHRPARANRARAATRVKNADEDGRYRVFRDPAGHTFCLVWGTDDEDV